MSKVIKNQMKKLKKELYKIHCQNWILSHNNNKGSAGEMLEELLGKDRDNYSLPDYKNIEIKSRKSYSEYPIHLFCCALDGKPLEMHKLLKIGGYPSKSDPTQNCFNTTIDSVSRKDIRKYSYILSVDYDSEKVKLLIYVRNSNILANIMSWSFKELQLRLESKLSYLAIVLYKSCKVKENNYFKYEMPTFYVLKDFKTFLHLIEIGVIKVTFKLSYYKSGEKYGEILDKGTSFDVNYEDINLLFNKIEVDF